MKIYFERSGGFMGLPLKATLDTAALPSEEAEALEEMFQEADFFQLPPAEEDERMVAEADQMTYTVKVVEGPAVHTVCVTDSDTPEGMQPLLRHLTLMARRPSAGAQDAESS